MFSHLKKNPSKQFVDEVYEGIPHIQLGVGAVEFTEIVGGVQQVSKPVADALNQVLANRYPVLTASAYFNGAASPGPDGNADYWSYAAYPASYFSELGEAPPTVSAADQIKAMGGVVLVDIANAKQVLEGAPAGLVYIIGRDDTVKGLFAGPTSSSAVLSPLASAGADKTPSKKSSATPLLVAVAAGVGGALVGGPVLGAVAAVAGYYVASA